MGKPVFLRLPLVSICSVCQRTCSHDVTFFYNFTIPTSRCSVKRSEDDEYSFLYSSHDKVHLKLRKKICRPDSLYLRFHRYHFWPTLVLIRQYLFNLAFARIRENEKCTFATCLIHWLMPALPAGLPPPLTQIDMEVFGIADYPVPR
jgi:hypothetical protein